MVRDNVKGTLREVCESLFIRKLKPGEERHFDTSIVRCANRSEGIVALQCILQSLDGGVVGTVLLLAIDTATRRVGAALGLSC